MEYEKVLLHLSNVNERLNTRYMYALSDMTRERLSGFQQVWPHIDVNRRRFVILVAMGDEDHEVRAAAIDGLWENEDQALIGPLVHLLRADDAPNVRAAAATALGRFVLLGELGDIDRAPAMLAEEALLKALRHGEEVLEVRRRAIEAIAYSGEAGVREIIENAYYDEDEEMQASALFAMGRSADPYWRAWLVRELENPGAEIRFEAARACGELEASKAISQLTRMTFADPDREVQQAAVWALGRIGGRESRAALEACYESDDEALSEAAAEALDEMDLLGESMGISLYEDFDEYE